MSKWQLPATGGNMEVNNGIYYQNMTNKDVAERLKKNDIILIPVGHRLCGRRSRSAGGSAG